MEHRKPDKQFFFAEVKTASPFGFRSGRSWGELFDMANKHGDIISIHTDPRWEGSFGLVEQARRMTNKPILAKGIHETDDDIERALQAGADYVLVVGRVPEKHLDSCLVEPWDIEQLSRLDSNTTRVVWNSRDLGTSLVKKETFSDIRQQFSGWLCQASFIKNPLDVDESADGFIVGENLPQYVRSLQNPSHLLE